MMKTIQRPTAMEQERCYGRIVQSQCMNRPAQGPYGAVVGKWPGLGYEEVMRQRHLRGSGLGGLVL